MYSLYIHKGLEFTEYNISQNDIIPINRCAICFEELGNYDKAIECYNKIIEINSKDINV